MATILPQVINRNSSVTLNYVAANEGDLIANSKGDTVISIKNGGASAITITAPATIACDQKELHNLSLSVEAGAEESIQLSKRLNNASGQVPLTYSDTTNVTIAAFTVIG